MEKKVEVKKGYLPALPENRVWETPLSTYNILWILYSRVWVHHLSLSPGHRTSLFQQWPTQFFLFADICKWMQISGSLWILGRLSLLFLWTRRWDKKATIHCCSSGGLNSSSGGELKLYLKWKRNMYYINLKINADKLSNTCILIEYPVIRKYLFLFRDTHWSRRWNSVHLSGAQSHYHYKYGCRRRRPAYPCI